MKIYCSGCLYYETEGNLDDVKCTHPSNIIERDDWLAKHYDQDNHPAIKNKNMDCQYFTDKQGIHGALVAIHPMGT